MDVSYDIWTGESMSEVIQYLAQFRMQLFAGTDRVEERLSDEMGKLTDFFDEDAMIIAANDCGQLVGVITMVGLSEHVIEFVDYHRFGDLVKVTEGPIVHPYYRGMGIGQGLLRELINECEIRNIDALLVQSGVSKQTTDTDQMDAVTTIAKRFDLSSVDHESQVLFSKIWHYN